MVPHSLFAHGHQAETKVSFKRQKLIGLKTKAGKVAVDEDSLSDLAIKVRCTEFL